MGYVKKAITDFWNHVQWWDYENWEYMAEYVATYHNIHKTPAQIRKIAKSIK